MTKERGLAEIDASGVRSRQRYRHWKGHVYTVVATALEEHSLEPVVVYSGADGVVWVRALTVFTEQFDNGKRRFALVEDDAHQERGGRFL